MCHRPAPAFPRTMVAFLGCAVLGWLAVGPLAAGPPPVAVGEEVQFTDLSTNFPLLWLWDFDYDGVDPHVDAVEQHPVTTFDAPGTYQVYLETCNVVGCGTVIKSVVVEEEPGVLFQDDFETGTLDTWSAVSP